MKKFITSILFLVFPLIFVAPAFAFNPGDLVSQNWWAGMFAKMENRQETTKKTSPKTWMKKHMVRKSDNTPGLDKLVANGKLTQAQEDAIKAEIKVLQTKYGPDTMKNLTPAERQEKFKEMQAEIQTWAKAQDIDFKNLMPFGGMMGGLKQGTNYGMMKKWPSPTPSQ